MKARLAMPRHAISRTQSKTARCATQQKTNRQHQEQKITNNVTMRLEHTYIHREVCDFSQGQGTGALEGHIRLLKAHHQQGHGTRVHNRAAQVCIYMCSVTQRTHAA